MSASPARQLHCSQCGARLAAPVHASGAAAVHECEYCGTVVVTKSGHSRVAGRAVGAGVTIDWAQALCCRLCGGALPASVVAEPERTRCEYCGHRALLRPGVLAAIRLIVTRPRLAPPTLRRAVLFNVGFVVAAIAITALGIYRHDGTTRYGSHHFDLAELRPGQLLADWQGEVPSYTRAFGLRAVARNHVGGKVVLDLSVHHPASNTCQRKQLALSPRPSGYSSARLNLDGEPPVGNLRGRVVVIDVEGSPRGELDVIMSGNQAFSVGYLAFMLNAVLWLTFFNVRAGVDFTAMKRSSAKIMKAISALFLVAWLAVTVFGMDPLASTRIATHQRTDCGGLAE